MSRLLAPADRFPVAAALLVTVLWSSSWVLVKLGLDDLPPLTFAGLRYCGAAMVLGVLLLASPAHRSTAAALPRPAWGPIVMLGVVLYALTQGAQFVALSMLPAATLSLLLSFTPVLVMLVARRWLAEAPRPGQALGLALALCGAAAYLGPEFGVTSRAGLLVGALGLAANAAAALLGRAVNRDQAIPALVVTAPSMATGGLLLLSAGLATEPAPAWTPTTVVILAWLVLANTAFAFTLWNHTQRHLSATESSTVNNTMLVQIAVLGWVFLGEAHAPLQWSGLLVATAGSFLVQRPRR